jgi:hypothetical protein
MRIPQIRIEFVSFAQQRSGWLHSPPSEGWPPRGGRGGYIPLQSRHFSRASAAAVDVLCRDVACVEALSASESCLGSGQRL